MYRYVFYFNGVHEGRRVNAWVRWDSPRPFASVDEVQSTTIPALIETNNGFTEVRLTRIELA